jgi:steroid delta-isomerase-like uncharacterized protein
MTRKQAQRILRQHQDALNRHDVPALAAMYADDAVLESPMLETIRGREAIGVSYERLFTLFPDYSITTRDPLFISEGDRAAEFTTVTGTLRAPLLGMVPTGQPIEYQAARLFTFRGELIAHEQRIYDFGGVLERLDKTRTDRELATASAVQQMLMARTDLKGKFFEVARVSVPCRSITGDFLEYHHVPSVSFGLALGDVSGKGPPAALVAAMLNGMLAMIPDGLMTPDVLLERLNVSLCQRHIDSHYATLSYARLTSDRRLTYANAGHPPPLLVSADGVRPLTAGGPMLGLLDFAMFPSETLHVASGDSVIFYSDGVSEALAPDGEEFGVDRLMAAAAEHAAARPPALVEALLAAVRKFADGAPSVDDATIAALRVQ